MKHHNMKGFHGSPKESHEVHGGKAEVPKELMVGAGPGKAAAGIKPSMSASQFEGGSKTSGKAKGLKTYDQE